MKLVLGDLHRHQPRPSRRLQVHRLRRRERQRHGAPLRRRRKSPSGSASGPAGGDLVLHVQGHELRHRRVPGRRAADAPLHRLHVLRSLFPGPRGGAHHSLRRVGRADEGPRAHDGQVRPRRGLSRVRHGEEDPPRQPHGAHCRHRVRRGAAALLRRVVRRGRVRVPDLLRLLGVLGHGGRARADDGLRADPELRLAVPVGQHHRLLAALAHQLVDLAARLSLHSARAATARGQTEPT